jgi:hypothetical protein
MTRTTLRMGAVVCAAALALAGCTSNNDDSSPDAGASLPAEGPLTEFLGFSAIDSGVPGLPQLTEQEEMRQGALQEIVTKCMAEAGFDYIPVSVADHLTAAFGDAYQLPAEEFAARYGYGVTTLEASVDQEAPVDPNEEIRDGLSPDDQDAYDAALWGGVDDDGPGCYGLATAEVYGTGGEDDGLTEFQDLFNALGELYREIDEDPRLAAAHQDWAGCMADAGYPDLTTPADAQQAVLARVSELRGDEDAMPEVQEFELAIAAADYACQQEHVFGPRTTVVTELEDEFVAQHRDELERYRDWLNS